MRLPIGRAHDHCEHEAAGFECSGHGPNTRALGINCEPRADQEHVFCRRLCVCRSEERMTIASMKQQGSSVRAMARTLGRSASTVSRELTRNTCSVVGYASADRKSA